MKPKTKMAAKTIGAAVAAATVGYVAGVLSAPASGAHTRNRIGKKVSDETENFTRNAKQGMKDAKEKVAGAFIAGKEKVAAFGAGKQKPADALIAGKDQVASFGRG